jgi:carbon storage regulator CsrA
MLVLGRKVGQAVNISPNISLVVPGIKGSSVTLAFECPRDTKIFREELIEATSDDECLEEETRWPTEFMTWSRSGILQS